MDEPLALPCHSGEKGAEYKCALNWSSKSCLRPYIGVTVTRSGASQPSPFSHGKNGGTTRQAQQMSRAEPPSQRAGVMLESRPVYRLPTRTRWAACLSFGPQAQHILCQQ